MPKTALEEDETENLSEEGSEDDKQASEIEKEEGDLRRHAEPKGGSGMSSLKGDGTSTREQTQKGGWGPPGVERDQADWDHLPTHSTPLVKRNTLPSYRERSGEVTVRSAGQGRVTTTLGKPKSRSDVVISGASPQKRGTNLEETGYKREVIADQRSRRGNFRRQSGKRDS